MYCAYITTLKDVRKHANADRLQVATVFGNDVIVDLTYHTGQRVIYFPTDGQLSEEFANDNNLVRRKDENGNNIGGYLDPDKRNITALKLRGEKSDGLILPIEVLSKYIDINELHDGDQITILNGHEICKKYIPRRQTRQGSTGAGNRTRKHKEPVAPLFAEHADTEQLAYNLSAFKPGDQIEITLKMHGTSQRTGRLPVFKGYKRTFGDKIFRRKGTPIYDWGYVSGTRRVVLDDFEGGYYGSNHFREQHSKFFEGKLQKGETVYYEVVGFTDSGAPIMSSVPNKRTGDKEFIKQYGRETTFSYGCTPDGKDAPQSDFYVYRMTMTNEDGFVVEYTPDFMRYRCEQMGCKCVPEFYKGYIKEYDLVPEVVDEDSELKSAGEYSKELAEVFYDGRDPVGKSHVREGVVVRIVNRPKFTAYKHKNFSFKCLEGIAKADAAAPDMEEAQEETAEGE